MNASVEFPRWLLPLFFVACFATAASADLLTLDNAGSNWGFQSDSYVISGAMVNNVMAQPAAFEAFHHYDKNNSGAWDGGDGRRRSIGNYDNGLFHLSTMSENWGALNGIDAVAGAHGFLEIDDILITNTGSSPPTVATSLNFDVSGSASSFNWMNNGLRGGALEMSITLNGSVFDGNYAWLQSGSGSPLTDVSGLGTQIAGGGFSDIFNSTITTGLVEVPVNSPFSIRLDFAATSTSGGIGGTYVGMTFNADTAGFLPGSSVFNLPAGYTANSGSGLITDNKIGVPEPTGFAFLGSLISLVLLGRRRSVAISKPKTCSAGSRVG